MVGLIIDFYGKTFGGFARCGAMLMMMCQVV